MVRAEGLSQWLLGKILYVDFKLKTFCNIDLLTYQIIRLSFSEQTIYVTRLFGSILNTDFKENRFRYIFFTLVRTFICSFEATQTLLQLLFDSITSFVTAVFVLFRLHKFCYSWLLGSATSLTDFQFYTVFFLTCQNIELTFVPHTIYYSDIWNNILLHRGFTCQITWKFFL